MKISGLDIDIRNGHFVANDGCMQRLEKSPIQLSEKEDIVEDHNLLMTPSSGNPEPRIRNLLYFNDIMMGVYFRTHGELPVLCPKCRNRYVIRKEDYELLKKAESQKHL